MAKKLRSLSKSGKVVYSDSAHQAFSMVALLFLVVPT